MFVSPFLAVMAAMVLWPLQTQRLFAELKHWQVSQIALDNAAIRLGREERRYRKWVEDSKRRLEWLERQHHFWHRCSRVPQTAAKCTPLDRAWEVRVRWFGRKWSWQNRHRWKKAEQVARREGARLHRRLELHRPAEPPFSLGRCAVCGLSARIETLRELPWIGEWELEEHPFRVRVRTGPGGYELSTGER